MTAGRRDAPGIAGCEPEWLARPLTDLIHHLTQNYKKPIALRLEAITATANQTRLAAADVLGRMDHGSGAFAVRLSSLVTTLRLVLEAHAWSEADVLFPAANAIETYGRKSAPSRTMEECVTAGLSVDLDIFLSDLEIVCFMIAEKLDLEDRCLWPRMKELFDR
jgi:hypothetical protein